MLIKRRVLLSRQKNHLIKGTLIDLFSKKIELNQTPPIFSFVALFMIETKRVACIEHPFDFFVELRTSVCESAQTRKLSVKN